jgi:DnaJ-class molecular chaperone
MSYTQESGHEQDHAREQITSGNLIFKLINDVQGCPYFVLELPMKASIADVKKGYKKLAIQHHPDKVMGTEEKKGSKDKISKYFQCLPTTN